MSTLQRIRDHVLAGTAATVILFLCGCDRSGGASTHVATDEAPAPGAVAETPVAIPPADAPPARAATMTAPPVADAGDKSEVAKKPEAGGHGPQMTFTHQVHDFGEVWDVDKQTTGFDFTNTGDATLVVERVKTSCGCTAAQLDKREYAPGEGSTIDVAFTPKGFGRQSKTIDVFTNISDQPVRLSITAQIKQFIEISPAAVRFNKVKLGEEHRQVVTVSSPDPDFEIISVDATARTGRSRDNYLSARLVQDQPNTVELILSKDAPWGPLYGSVTVTAKGTLEEGAEPITHSGRASVSAEIVGELDAEPNMFRIGAVPPETAFSKEVRIRRTSGQPFTITHAEVEGARMPGLRVEVVAITAGDKSGYKVQLIGEPDTYIGPIGGTVVVGTDVPGEEEMRFSIGGIIREPVVK